LHIKLLLTITAWRSVGNLKYRQPGLSKLIKSTKVYGKLLLLNY